MSASRTAVRDTVLSIGAETVVAEYTVLKLRCGRCGHVREIRTEVHPTAPGCPPMPAMPRTTRCPPCGRVCRTDNANMPEVNPWPTTT